MRAGTADFVLTGSSFAYFEATRSYLEQHGKPAAFYSDKASTFRPVTKAEFSERGVTQLARVLDELNIDIMCANTSQAKGRVERANLTLQDRLVRQRRLRGISTLKAANALAPHFVATSTVGSRSLRGATSTLIGRFARTKTWT